MKKVLSIIIFIPLVFIVPVLIDKIKMQREAKVLFVGDMSFDRHIRKISTTKGGDYIFSCIGDFLKEADLVVGNLEGPITENVSVSLGSEIGSPNNFIFTFPTTTPSLLKKYNIQLLNLGNNHIDDFGKSGLLSTRDYLDKSGIKYFGGFGGDEPVYQTKIGGTNITFISYNQFGGESYKKVAEKIADENRSGQMVVVYTHWGEEYLPATSLVKSIAKTFADSGAKLIVGSHPHIVLPSEKIGKTIVYYSLGNFIFDQYWNNEVSTGLILEINIKEGNMDIFERNVSINRDGKTCLSSTLL